MKLQPVAGTGSPYFGDFWRLYESAFPPDERRDLERQKALFARKEYSLFAAIDGGFVGFISLWEFADFVFMEHLAVEAKLRGKGIGTAIMKEYMGKCRKKAILEVEPPKTAAQKKRVSFYRQLGFALNGHPYVQPPYGPGKKPVRMLLMSHPSPISGAEFAEARGKIHTLVYGLAKPLE